MSCNAICENKIISKISGFTVIKPYICGECTEQAPVFSFWVCANRHFGKQWRPRWNAAWKAFHQSFTVITIFRDRNILKIWQFLICDPLKYKTDNIMLSVSWFGKTIGMKRVESLKPVSHQLYDRIGSFGSAIFGRHQAVRQIADKIASGFAQAWKVLEFRGLSWKFLES